MINITPSVSIFSLANWIVYVLIIVELIWLWSIVIIARAKPKDPFDRIVWLLIVLMLNFIGTILYSLFGCEPESKEEKERRKRSYDESVIKRANDGTL